MPTLKGEIETKPTIDNHWDYRADNRLCKTCMSFASKKSGTSKIGRCRRHAPTMNGYPPVFETDWCGDHKIDEDKI